VWARNAATPPAVTIRTGSDVFARALALSLRGACVICLTLVASTAFAAEPEPATIPPAKTDGVAPEASDAASAPAVSPSAPPSASDGAPNAVVTRAEFEALAKELRELKAQREAEQPIVPVESEGDQPLRIYGFADIGLRKIFPAKDPFIRALTAQPLTFELGNVNLYFDAQPIQDWRALIETRLTTYPHGAETVDANGRFVRTDTRTFDTNSPSGRNRVIWSGIVLERAQIEHTITDLFNVRVGYFLTPYGIWNVDHGTPTLISLVLPAAQVEEAIPARQLGAQIYGSIFSGPWELGYSAYISNGRAPWLVDISDNKAFGGRLTAKTGETRPLQLGLSGYYGDSGDNTKQLDLSNPDQIGITVTKRYHYREWALGADLSLDIGGFRLRTEGVVRRLKYDDGLHEPISFGAPGTFEPNRHQYYWYGIFAYRIGDFEPYAYTEVRYITPRDAEYNFTYQPSLGLNVYLSSVSQLKAQYAAAKFYDTAGTHEPSSRNFRSIDLRYVMAF
jgi:hypothetical protein